MAEKYELEPIGFVRSTRTEPHDDGWSREVSSIVLAQPFDHRAVRGLEEFSHCLVVYVFDRAKWDVSRMVRHPRGNVEWPEVGIFAQRAKDRPNRLGVAVCRVIVVEGSTICVDGLDAIDGTPVVDIKPWMDEFGPRSSTHQPSWSHELMRDYW